MQPSLKVSPVKAYFLRASDISVFSASWPKAQMHYDHALSDVCPSLTFHIFEFSSETAEQNLTKLDRKQELNIFYPVCAFGLIEKKNKMAGLSWDYLRHFRLLFCERNSTKLDRKQDINAIYQVCVFLADRKTRWPPWPLIGWDIFDFSSDSAERNSTKLDKKQDLNVLFQACVFRADRKKQDFMIFNDLMIIYVYKWCSKVPNSSLSKKGWCNKPTKLQLQSILTRKILTLSNATNQQKSTVELGYM